MTPGSDGVIRPPRGGAPSCGTKHLRSVRSVSAKQVGNQTSSADGSCELAGAPPKCAMASLAGLSRHRRPCARCGHVALPIVRIGASPKGVACSAPPRRTPRSGTHWTWTVDDSHRISQGHHRDTSYLAFANCTRSSAIARRAKWTTSSLRRLHWSCATNDPKHCKSPLQKVKIFKSLSPPGDPPAIRLPRTRL